MNKLAILIISILFSAVVADAQNGWVNYHIDTNYGVKFPMQPHSIDGTEAVLAKDKDSSAYMVMVLDFKKVANIDSGALAPLLDKQEFADQLKQGMQSKMPGSYLGDVTIGKWGSNYSYSLKGENSGKKLKLFAYMVIVGTNMYGMMAIIPEANTTQGKDYFFSTFSKN